MSAWRTSPGSRPTWCTAADGLPAFPPPAGGVRGPAGKPHPVSIAGRAIVRGIERRSPVVAAPRWVVPARWLRGFIGPLVEKQVQGNAPEVMALLEGEYEREGAQASRPVGAGGAADARAAGGRGSVGA